MLDETKIDDAILKRTTEDFNSHDLHLSVRTHTHTQSLRKLKRVIKDTLIFKSKSASKNTSFFSWCSNLANLARRTTTVLPRGTTQHTNIWVSLIKVGLISPLKSFAFGFVGKPKSSGYASAFIFLTVPISPVFQDFPGDSFSCLYYHTSPR